MNCCKIIQIIPAQPGLRAAFWDESDERIFYEDVLCLALIEEHEDDQLSTDEEPKRIVAVLCGVVFEAGKEFAEDGEGFIGLFPQNAPVPDEKEVIESLRKRGEL